MLLKLKVGLEIEKPEVERFGQSQGVLFFLSVG